MVVSSHHIVAGYQQAVPQKRKCEKHEMKKHHSYLKETKSAEEIQGELVHLDRRQWENADQHWQNVKG